VPTTTNKDPIALAKDLATYTINNKFDGVDVNYEGTPGVPSLDIVVLADS